MGYIQTRERKKCKVYKMVHEKIREMKRKMKSWRKRIQLSFGHDPLMCPKCGKEMSLTDIVYPGVGSVIDLIREREYDKIKHEVQEIQRHDEVIRDLIKSEPLYI